MASFAALGDVIIAEPRALIGFAGPNVIRQTIRSEIPEGFQSLGVPDPVKLIGPRGLHDLHRALRGVYGSWIDLENRVRIQEVHPGHRKGFFSIGPIEVTCFSVDHTDNSVAYRFESRSGKVLAYSGDTDRCSGVVEAGR